MNEQSVAQTVVDFLRLEGVDYLFAVPGSAIEELMDVFYNVEDVRFLTAQHEQGAGYMAHGYARVTGRPGVCAVTKGPGGTNLLTSIAMAWYESAPVVAILGDASTKNMGRQRSAYQETDYVSLFKPITKRVMRLERADRAVEALQIAFRTAMSGRRGPVALAIPSNLLQEKINVELTPPEHYRVSGQPRGNPDQIQQAAELLARADRIALLLGGGARLAGAGPAALEVAELTGALVGSTASAKSVIDEDHPRSLECVGRHGNPLSRFVHEADVVLAVGTTLTETTTMFRGSIIRRDASLIHVDIDPEEIGRVYPVAVGVVGDARLVLEDLAAELRRMGKMPLTAGDDAQVRALAQAKHEWHEELKPRADSDEVPIRRLRFQKEVRAALPRDTIFMAEGGGTINYYMYSFPVYTNGFGVGDLSPLGSGYPFALGLQCGAPDRQVVSMHGDGAFMFTMNEMATAVRWGINTVAMVLHNSVYGNERNVQHQHRHARYVGTDLYIPDLARVAQSFGAYGERVEQPGQIGPAIERALRAKKPAILDVIISNAVEELMPPRRDRAPGAGH